MAEYVSGIFSQPIYHRITMSGCCLVLVGVGSVRNSPTPAGARGGSAPRHLSLVSRQVGLTRGDRETAPPGFPPAGARAPLPSGVSGRANPRPQTNGHAGAWPSVAHRSGNTHGGVARARKRLRPDLARGGSAPRHLSLVSRQVGLTRGDHETAPPGFPPAGARAPLPSGVSGQANPRPHTNRHAGTWPRVDHRSGNTRGGVSRAR